MIGPGKYVVSSSTCSFYGCNVLRELTKTPFWNFQSYFKQEFYVKFDTYNKNLLLAIFEIIGYAPPPHHHSFSHNYLIFHRMKHILGGVRVVFFFYKFEFYIVFLRM